MSTVEHEAAQAANQEAPETAERPFLVRSFETASAEVEGRTVDVRVVPFGEVARVSDDGRTEYDEQWMPGCFDHQLRAAFRIPANYKHRGGILDVVGHGLALRSEADGYHATFEIHETPQGETALAMIRAGALPSVSLEAVARKAVRSASGVVQRVKADLRGLAFCQVGAFAGAQVLAVREQHEQVLDAALMPVPIDPELVERLRAQGAALPSRYQAHPEGEGTPDGSGTPSVDGTRHADHNDSTEE